MRYIQWHRLTPKIRRNSIPRISVIIVNYRAADYLPRCVESLAQQTVTDFECFIVDNGTDIASQTICPDLDDRFKIITLDSNTGFAKANNIGARKARADWLACLNPDAFARPDWLEQLLSATKLLPGVTMVGSTQIMAEEPEYYDGNGDCYHISGLAWRADCGRLRSEVAQIQTCEVFAPCAAGSLYHKETFLRLGGFDESFFCYHEDVDLGFRLRLAGGRCIQSAEAIIDHVGSGIAGRASAFSVYYGTRNRIWTFFKSMPLLGILLFTPLHLGLNILLLIWAAFRPGRFKPTLKGMSAGFAGVPKLWKSRRKVQQTRTVGLSKILPYMAFKPSRSWKRQRVSRPVDQAE